MEKIKECIVCGKALKGRSDKKFCQDECRSAFHNDIRKVDLANIRFTNRILKRNRDILKGMSQENINCSTYTWMKNRGFEFEYFTNVLTTPEKTHYFVYEYGYYMEGDNCHPIEKLNDYENLDSKRTQPEFVRS